MSDATLKPPRRNPGVAFRIMDGQGMIAVPGRSEIHLLNEVGTRIYELVDGARDEEEIARIIVEEFDVTPEAARAHVQEFLEDLFSKGALA